MLKRTRHGSKPADLSSLRALFADGKVWSAVGVVRARQGENSHFSKTDGDVIVDVDLSPEGTPAWCRLGGQLGGEGIGAWRIPPPGTEVGVLLPDGNPKSDPMIVCTLSSGSVPDGLDGDVLMIVNTKKVQLVSTEGAVEVNGSDYSMLKTETLLRDLASALGTILASNSGGPIVATPTPPGVTSIATLIANLTMTVDDGNPYLSTRAKNG